MAMGNQTIFNVLLNSVKRDFDQRVPKVLSQVDKWDNLEIVKDLTHQD